MRLLTLLLVLVQVVVSVPALADAYEDGLQLYARRLYADAAKIWEPIAEAGNAAAQNSMGVLYENGQGVQKDLVVAAKWYLRSALNGSTDAQFNVGLMYEGGRGVERDYARAYKWFDLATTAGGMRPNVADAITARNRVATKLTAEQVTVAKDLAKKCKDSKFWECD